MQPGHTLVLVNDELTWRGAQDIGQPWDRGLKQAAEALLQREAWHTLYSCRMVRTSRGRGYGLLVGAWGSGWHLWPATEEVSSSVADGCVLSSATRPPQEEVVAALNAAADAARGGRKRGLLDGLWPR